MWAGQSPVKNELAEDAEIWGFELADRYKEPERIVIWPQHAEAFSVFGQCAGQWRYLTPFGSVPIAQGIDRTALASVMQMLGIEDQCTTLRQVQQIESGALEVMRKK